MPNRPAKPTDWKTKPLPDRHSRVALNRAFTPDELARIQHGLIPEAMEDKWFVYWLDDQLYLHRSWTGFCTYIVDFTVTDDGAAMTAARINRDPDQYQSTDDEYDSRMISFLIDVLLLRRPAAFPATQDSPGNRALEQWSVVGRASIGEHPEGSQDDH